MVDGSERRLVHVQGNNRSHFIARLGEQSNAVLV